MCVSVTGHHPSLTYSQCATWEYVPLSCMWLEHIFHRAACTTTINSAQMQALPLNNTCLNCLSTRTSPTCSGRLLLLLQLWSVLGRLLLLRPETL